MDGWMAMLSITDDRLAIRKKHSTILCPLVSIHGKRTMELVKSDGEHNACMDSYDRICSSA